MPPLMIREISIEDEWYLSRCIALAQLGAGYTAPNPMVGAVLVHNGRILSEGWHAIAGGPHAEVHCINNVATQDRQLLPQSCLYVSLEPCSHYGKTPPCTSLIIESKIPKVVIASQDTFSKVNGQGIARLQEAGVEVVVANDQYAARLLNKHFFTFHEQARPYVLLKWAQTVNGIIGTGTSERLLISNAFTQRWVHQLRSNYQAILVGVNTIIQDDPLLDNRFYVGKAPLKVIIDVDGVLPVAHRILHEGADTWIFTAEGSCKARFAHLPQVKVILISHQHVVQQIMQYLFEQQILSVLVEGGATTLQGFINAGAWDEAYVIEGSQTYVGNGIAAPILYNMQLKSSTLFTGDTIMHFTNVHNSIYL